MHVCETIWGSLSNRFNEIWFFFSIFKRSILSDLVPTIFAVNYAHSWKSVAAHNLFIFPFHFVSWQQQNDHEIKILTSTTTTQMCTMFLHTLVAIVHTYSFVSVAHFRSFLFQCTFAHAEHRTPMKWGIKTCKVYIVARVTDTWVRDWESCSREHKYKQRKVTVSIITITMCITRHAVASGFFFSTRLHSGIKNSWSNIIIDR